MAQIEFKNVSYVYGMGTPFEKTALDDFNILIEKGIITGLIGHTGSGKSTLALLICGLLKPTRGSIYIDGEEMYKAEAEVEFGEGSAKKKRKIKGSKKHNRENSQKMRFKAGIIFQYPEYQLFEENVYKDIAYGPTNMGLSEEEIDRRVKDAAEFAGIMPDLFEKSPFELSGGQKRRVAIAGVMAMDPPILILDEPAAGLDPRGRAEILGGMCEYQKITGKTMIMISHSMEDMARYSDKVLVIKEAKPYLYGTVDEIFSQAQLLKGAGLSIPQITKLFIELKKRGINVNENIYNLDKAKNEIASLLTENAEKKELID